MTANRTAAMELDDWVARLRERDPAPLAPACAWNAGLRRWLETAEQSGDPRLRTAALRSVLFLWNDCLTDSHALSQTITTATGSYLHGIMHRREPDYANARYWFRRVGRHALFPAVRTVALAVARTGGAEALGAAIAGRPHWDPFRMIDWCAEEERGTGPRAAVVRAIQHQELRLLVEALLAGTDA